MRRVPDWTARLSAAIRDGATQPYCWGGWDCCAAAAFLVDAMSDGAVDLTEPFRWTTRAGATRTLRAYLGRPDMAPGDLLASAALRRGADLGLPLVSTSRAQRGDILLVSAETPWGMSTALAVVDMTGRQGLTAAVDGGWAEAPSADWLRAWRL